MCVDSEGSVCQATLGNGGVSVLPTDGRPIWHEGLDPDVRVELADTAFPLRPEMLLDLSAAEVAASGDAQLLRALQLLRDGG